MVATASRAQGSAGSRGCRCFCRGPGRQPRPLSRSGPGTGTGWRRGCSVIPLAGRSARESAGPQGAQVRRGPRPRGRSHAPGARSGSAPASGRAASIRSAGDSCPAMRGGAWRALGSGKRQVGRCFTCGKLGSVAAPVVVAPQDGSATAHDTQRRQTLSRLGGEGLSPGVHMYRSDRGTHSPPGGVAGVHACSRIESALGCKQEMLDCHRQLQVSPVARSRRHPTT